MVVGFAQVAIHMAGCGGWHLLPRQADHTHKPCCCCPRLPAPQGGNARLPQLGHAGVAALTTAALPLCGGSAVFLGGCGAGVVHICSLEVGSSTLVTPFWAGS